MTVDSRRYELVFYGPVRLAQTIACDLERGPAFFERNLVVVPAVTRANMEAAIATLVKAGGCADLVPDDHVSAGHES